MTVEEAIKVIQTERECVSRQQCDRDCAKCDLVMKDTEIISAYDMAISALLLYRRNIGWENSPIRKFVELQTQMGVLI